MSYKYIIIGDKNVGKTKIAETFCTGKYDPKPTKTTVGIEFKYHVVRVGNKDISISIADTAGQERHQSINQNFYRNVDCAFIVYDVTNTKSFDNVIEWFNQLDIFGCRDDILIVMIGTKTDLSERTISQMMGKKLSKDLGIIFRETTATDPKDIKEIFQDTACYLIEKRPFIPADHNTIEIRKEKEKKKKGFSCCSIS